MNVVGVAEISADHEWPDTSAGNLVPNSFETILTV